MAWRPYENLLEGELDNTTFGHVTGWIKFFRNGKRPLKVKLNLKGDFLEDIFGKKIRIKNKHPKDSNDLLNRKGTYLDGFARIQQGEVGDITAGIPVNGQVPYVSYPYIEWYSKRNGRVVLELEHHQIEIVEERSPFMTPMNDDQQKSQHDRNHEQFEKFMANMAKGLKS